MRGGRSRSTTLMPPVGGWDARSALADMPPENAVILDNWFPGTDRITLRRGSVVHVDDLPGRVETLLEYVRPGGAPELFAAVGGEIHNVTAPGSAGSPAASGFSNDRWQFTQIGNPGGDHYLFAVNGEDVPQVYDGAIWDDSTIAASGLAPENLVWTNLHQRRLWFGERGSQDAWYLDVDAISGTPDVFPLGGLAGRGGEIVGMGTWTRDGGDGTDDVAVFVTSEGQAILYAGTDPSSAADWEMIGVFDVGRPIGRRPMIKAGADLILVTEDGFLPASRVLSLDRSQTERVALSAQINAAVNAAVRDRAPLFGWQPILYPRATMLIVNIPLSSTTAEQFVFNTLTGAPCRFTGLPALCWGRLGERIMFGAADGTVREFDIGTSDAGEPIAGDALPAFSWFGSPGQIKAFKQVEPIFQSDGLPSAALDLAVDFQVRAPVGVPVTPASIAGLWDAGLWDDMLWGGDAEIYRGWRGVRGYGRSAALRVRVRTTTSRPSWIATGWTWIEGGQL